MSHRIKMLILGGILTVYVLGSTGCAALWFVAGAGAAATAGAVMSEQEKEKVKK